MVKELLSVMVMLVILTIPKISFANDATNKWSGHIFAGYNTTNGNTKKGSGSLEAAVSRKVKKGILDLKANIFYSESRGKMDGQKWDALAKYSQDFGKDDLFYNFYQIYVDHDFFGDIDYRITPSAGLGYHILRDDIWKWDADAGLGYRISRSRSTGMTDHLPTALLHTFISRRVFEKSILSEDLTVYPGLESGSSVLTKSETAFICPLSEKLSLELKYILENNSKPAVNKKKTDTQFIAGLRYNF